MLSHTPVIAVCCPSRPRRRRSAFATIELHWWATTVEVVANSMTLFGILPSQRHALSAGRVGRCVSLMR